LVEALVVVRGPPVAQITVAVELAAGIVEAVADLMPIVAPTPP